MRIEELILNILTKDSEYIKKVEPHLKSEYFHSKSERTVFALIDNFYKKYSKLPPKDVMVLELENLTGLSQDDFSESKKVLGSVYSDQYDYDLQWMLDETEKFCKDKSVYNAIMQSVRIINGEEKKFSEGQIPTLLQDALSVSFDKNVGHDYFENAVDRYEFYTKKETRIKCSIDLINKITGGGFPLKTLCLLIAQSGGGKSAVMCSLAADFLRDGKNVLYITLELAEERVAERIDANLFNIQIQDIKELPEKLFTDKISQLKEKTHGKLIIKEYPTGAASVANFRTLIEELKAKKGFVPDVLIVDYLGITASSKYKNAAGVNTYTYQKSVAEELRGFGVENNMLVISAVQTNRGGFNSTDFDIESISDSAGILMTADLLLALIRSEDLDALQQMMIKQLKNRFGDPNYFKRFVVGMDRSRMKMYNIENTGQLSQEQTRDSSPSDKPALNRYKKTNQTSTEDWSF